MRRINLDAVEENMYLAKSIVSADGRVLLNEGILLEERYLNRLRDLGIYVLYVEDGRFDDVIVKDVICEKTRRDAVNVTRKIARMASHGESVQHVFGTFSQQIIDISGSIVKDILNNKSLIINLQDIRSMSDYLFFHSVNVSVLAVILGRALKLKEDQLHDIGAGALLHDIGKLLISESIVEKKSRLTDEEYNEIKKHTLYGYVRMRENIDIKLLWAHVALQHHEWFNGRGYPRGLKGNGIHMYGRVTSVADVYDALTSERCYRSHAYLPHEAMECIYSLSGTQFDPNIVNAFARNLAIYPLGAYLLLGDGRKGVVVDVNIGCIARPKLRIIEDDCGKILSQPYEVELERELATSIIRVLA